jgi:sterol desaturase/sphingolipid hydroxylase (fatty acid hydroxylase superfamily)
MIGIWQAYSDIYLYAVGAAMLAGFGIPLLAAPLRWAQAFRWDTSHAGNLVVAFGRSLGLMIALVAVFAFKAAAAPQAKPFFFDFLLWLVAANAALHIYGAIRRIQPITENFEIILWIVLFLATLCFYPV